MEILPREKFSGNSIHGTTSSCVSSTFDIYCFSSQQLNNIRTERNLHNNRRRKPGLLSIDHYE